MENLARWAMLARALHLSEHEPLDVIIALKVAVFEQKRLLLAKTEKHGNSNCVVDNRAIWVCAMIQGFWVSEGKGCKNISEIVATLCGLLRSRAAHELV